VLLFQEDVSVAPTGYSQDGRLLLFERAAESGEVWVLDVESGEASPVRQTKFGEGGGKFSPDGKWIAYHSDESGEWHIYVMPWPDRGRRWQVSKSPAVYPTWTDGGRELMFHEIGGTILAARVSGEGGTFVVDEPAPRLEIGGPNAGGARWSVTPDASTYLTIPDSLTETDPGLKLTFGWVEELKGK
jgi:dipeptidyl aminopeptidase/acylaminoacyl peptidase